MPADTHLKVMVNHACRQDVHAVATAQSVTDICPRSIAFNPPLHVSTVCALRTRFIATRIDLQAGAGWMPLLACRWR